MKPIVVSIVDYTKTDNNGVALEVDRLSKSEYYLLRNIVLCEINAVSIKILRRHDGTPVNSSEDYSIKSKEYYSNQDRAYRSDLFDALQLLDGEPANNPGRSRIWINEWAISHNIYRALVKAVNDVKEDARFFQILPLTRLPMPPAVRNEMMVRLVEFLNKPIEEIPTA